IVHRFSPGGFIFNVESKIVITVNDLFFYKAYHFNRAVLNRAARYFIRASLRKAHAIVSISEFTRSEVLKTFALDERKTHLLYCAPGITPMEPKPDVDILKKNYNVPSKYILFVSTIEPRKNITGLVKAYELLRERYHIEESLVIIGKKGWDYNPIINIIETSPEKDRIILSGFVSNEDLPVFYQNAALFLYPSFMEGFGIPPLEAMACGCPTLASNTTSLPEVMHYPEMMIDPYDIEDIVAKSIHLLRDTAFRDTNIQNGKKCRTFQLAPIGPQTDKYL
ncbi:glycosyltransferase family 4 protein, partial [Thermodesulfobacteriota bacterium]